MKHARISNLVAAVGVKPFVFERDAWKKVNHGVAVLTTRLLAKELVTSIELKERL